MPDTAPHAVFLSYASQDAEAVLRIVEALRASGVEVWFDQDELVGGDVWDAKIRGQIAVCALFVPVISAATQTRLEGYFRLEWKLAVLRTHTMAEEKAFLLPVVIDATRETDAHVPTEFKAVQWTRLPGGEPTGAFVDRVRSLVGLEGPPVSRPPSEGGGTMPASTRRRSPVPFFAYLAGACAIAGAIAVFFWSRQPAGISPGNLPHEAAATSPQPASVAPRLDAKSIAVLPFANLSDDKDNAFFADGVHEDILTNLANVGDLRVVSRTSVMQYRGTTKDVRQIANELGVAYVLEGSVRRAGNTVRVTGQLINARTDDHVWAKSYNRDLKDVFAIQSALATEIANSLQAVLTPRDKARLQRAPTDSSAAYDLYLRAADIRNRDGRSLEGLTRAAPLLQSALDLDPKFAGAWGELAMVHIGILRWTYDPTGAHLEKARQASETMERLAPDEPATWIQLAKYHAAVVDHVRAEHYIRRAAEAQPNNSWVVVQQGHAAKWHGLLADALSHYRKAYELDPQNPEARDSLRGWLRDTRRYDEAIALEQKDPRDGGYTLAFLAFYARGSTREMEAWLAAHPAVRSEDLMAWKFVSGDDAGLVRLADEARRSQPSGYLSSLLEVRYGAALMGLGQTARAREVWTANLARLKAGRQPDNAGVPVTLAFLGEKQAAFAAFDEFLARREKQTVNRDFILDAAAKLAILVRVGEREQALAELARLLKIPAGINVHELRHNPIYRPLRGDPTFEALLADPQNNAPLF